MSSRKKGKGKLKRKHFFVAVPIIGLFLFLGTNMRSGQHIVFEYLAEKSSKPVVQKEVLHVKTPETVKAVYMTSWVGSTKNLRDKLVKVAEETEINSIVLDIKDYTGKIAFEMNNSVVRGYGSSENRIKDIKEFIKELHGKNIYVIGRIAVFQDPYLAAKKPEWAAKTKSGAVWKDYKGMAWLDTCSKEVWDYTIAIAREAEAIGFDELNFDYVRFPSDGNMKDLSNHHCNKELTKADLLEGFFYHLRKGLIDLKIPISADLFGMVANNADDLNIGQVLERADSYFDYLAPMVYPSHYPAGHLGFANPAARPYEVIKNAMDNGVKRLRAVSSDPNKLRPWLQDFSIGATYDAEMVRKQKQAVYDAGLGSWMLWSPSNRYTEGALDKE
ncbi:hypothetical protein C4572_02625 [Candidatus Parcubacteria bacterium]|nr:MAG: hypothetical protein C4572_02625 [Candidatus Parcubacteria bacterium]